MSKHFVILTNEECLLIIISIGVREFSEVLRKVRITILF